MGPRAIGELEEVPKIEFLSRLRVRAKFVQMGTYTPQLEFRRFVTG